MASVEEGTHKLPDGKELYTKTWKAALTSYQQPEGSPIAVMIFLHGFSDHCNRYYDFFPTVAKSGILVHAFDQRGWGRSVKKPTERGLTGPSSMVMADITSIIKSHLPCSAPLFLMGHSMGGQETLFYASTGPAEIKKQITGFLAAAPYIRLDPSSEPNKVTVFAGRLASKMLPHMQLLQKLQPQWTSRDPAVCKSWEEDELCHNTGTLEGLAGMLDRAAALDTGAVELDEDCHVWIGHGTDDHITDYRASKSFYERSKARDKLLKLYDECYHCIHVEPKPSNEQFTADVVEFIVAHAKSSSKL